jgi:dipeptide/tripeptide permease
MVSLSTVSVVTIADHPPTSPDRTLPRRRRPPAQQSAGTAVLGRVAAEAVSLTAVLLLVAFVPIGAVSVLLVSMVQAIVPEHLLGRVIGLIMSTTSLAMPIGSLVGGGVSVVTSPTVILGVAGGTFALCSLYILAVPRLRQLPQVDRLPSLEGAGQ